MPVVLVIDDDIATLLVTRKLLEVEGYTVICAANGWEALLALEGQPAIDLMLLDVFMPGMDGATFLRIVRNDQRRHAIPIIVTIGSERSQMNFGPNHALAKGSADYPQKLLEIMRGILSGSPTEAGEITNAKI